jgi:DNA-directed RNA polymerase specialized sigma subunit
MAHTIDEASRKIAERAFRHGRTVREVARQAGISKAKAEQIRETVFPKKSGRLVRE